MSRMLALIVLLSAPLAAQDVDLKALYEKWRIEEERTLEGWRVLTDDTLIEKVLPLAAARDSRGEIARKGEPEANALACICYTRGVGGAPRDLEFAESFTFKGVALPKEQADYLRGLPYWSLTTAGGELDFRYEVIASGFERIEGDRSDWAPAQLLFALFRLSFERAGNRRDGVEALEKAAQAECLPAMVFTSRYLVRGDDMLRNVNSAEALLNKAAAADYLPALLELEAFHDYRHGVRPNLKRQREVLTTAVSLNLPGASRRLNDLPDKLLDEMTVHDLFSEFLAEWGEPVAVETELMKRRLLITGPSPVLARYDGLEAWLRPFADPDVLGEETAPAAYKAQCMLGALLVQGAKVSDEEGVSLLRNAATVGDWDAAGLLYAEQMALRDRWSAMIRLVSATERKFSPALRMQGLISLDWNNYDYDRAFAEAEKEKFKQKPAAALAQLEALAEASDLVACRALIKYYSATDGTQERKWIVKGANLGDPPSMFALGELYAAGKIPPPRPDSAITIFQRCLVEADSSDLAAKAEQKLAAYRDAAYVERATAMITELEASLTRHGDYTLFLNDRPGIAGMAQRAANADKQLGALYALCLMEGHGITRSVREAKKVLLAADDSAPASFLYGWIQERRLGDPGHSSRNAQLRSAVWTYQTVADVGGAYAAYRLAAIQSSDGDFLNRDAAFKNFKTAAEAGCIPAMVGLARAYKDGQGVAKDAAKAKEWAKKAADEGNLEAEALLELWE